MGQPRPLFVLFSFFSITILQKIVDLSGIRTRIVGVESEHADHLTTTTALKIIIYLESPKLLFLSIIRIQLRQILSVV